MSEPLTPEELDAIEQRVRAATPGPWESSQNGWIVSAPHANICGLHDGNDSAFWDGRPTGQGRPNADFIAHSREDVERLVAEVRRLRAAVDAMESVYITEQLRRG